MRCLDRTSSNDLSPRAKTGSTEGPCQPICRVGTAGTAADRDVSGGTCPLGAGLVLLGCLMALPPAIGATPVHVSPTGQDINDGSSWEAAKRTVASGVAAAVVGDQVWVAAGTYPERITLKTGVGLYGGFAGNEPADFDLAQRDLAVHASILDGNNAGTVVTTPAGATASTRIDGFTIRKGYANSGVKGGGVYCEYSSPTIANNKIVASYASSGGGISCYQCSPAIVNNTIIGNAASWGGGIYCSHGSPLIANNTIAGNSGWSYGGGICCEFDAYPVISNNTIVMNASACGGGISSYSASPVISNSIASFNSSGLYYAQGGTPTLSHNCVYNPGGNNYGGLPPGVGDISADPQLLAADYGDVHLKAGSPCIDAGDDTVEQPGWVDLDGQPRIQGAHVDIGADEFNGSMPPFTPKAVRVSLSGNNVNDGSTWALAKRTVQAGIDAAATAGGAEVWVAAGTYNERITLRAWAHLYGGFAGTEGSREPRDWNANATILDGDAKGSVVTANNNGYGPTSGIDGFTIRNGTGTFSGFYGGGIYCSSSSPAISNNVITGNNAGSAGGGIYCKSLSPSLSLPVIFNNAIVGNTAGMGGGIYCQICSPAIFNNTIADHSYGGGIYCDSSTPAISNNVVGFNSSGLEQSGGTSVLRNNCVYNPGGQNYHGLDPGTGDISVDPLFVNKVAGNYRLGPDSPCIDAGYDAAVPEGTLTDLGGHVRVIDDPATSDCRWSPVNCGTAPIVDMGAYEFIPVIPGDFDHDGDIDGDDLAVFEACLSGPGVAYTGDCAKADLHTDGHVDQTDFGIFQRCYSGANTPANPDCAN